jgi:hypothetical protein
MGACARSVSATRGSRQSIAADSTGSLSGPNTEHDAHDVGVARSGGSGSGSQGARCRSRVGAVRRGSDHRHHGGGPGSAPSRGHRRDGLSVAGRFPPAALRPRSTGEGNRSPTRTSASGAHSRMWRTDARGRNTRPGSITRLNLTRPPRSRQTTRIGIVMPIVWTDRHRTNHMPRVGGIFSRPRSPRARSRCVSGTSRIQVVPRGPSTVTACISEMVGVSTDVVPSAGTDLV